MWKKIITTKKETNTFEYLFYSYPPDILLSFSLSFFFNVQQQKKKGKKVGHIPSDTLVPDISHSYDLETGNGVEMRFNDGPDE